jgi:hypothetical protein
MTCPFECVSLTSHGLSQAAQSAFETGTLARRRESARVAYCFVRARASCEGGGGDGAREVLSEEKAEVNLPSMMVFDQGSLPVVTSLSVI